MPNWVKDYKWLLIIPILVIAFFIKQALADVDLNTKHRHTGETEIKAIKEDIGEIKDDAGEIKADVKVLLKRGKP